MNVLVRLALGIGAGMVAFGVLGSCTVASNQNKPLYGVYMCGNRLDWRLQIVDDTTITSGTEGITFASTTHYTYDPTSHLLAITPPSAADEPVMSLGTEAHVSELRYVPGGSREGNHTGPGIIAAGERQNGIDEASYPVFEPFSGLWCPYSG